MEIDRTPGKRHEDPGLVPIIWPFKVKWIEHVGHERLEEWHKVMREQVGIDLRGKPHMEADPAYEWSGDPCETISGSGNGWDDCDCW